MTATIELGDDAVIDLTDEMVGAAEILERFDGRFVGLAPVKRRIREIAALLTVDQLRRRFGIGSTRPALHMCFTGNPGTGKTTVAMQMGELLHRLGYLSRGHLVAVTRDDLVGQYIGHTAPKTKEVLKRAMGGVLFIDEAYYLYRAENERDYGQETIEILLQVMENERENLVVILAGYADKMESFFESNPGMGSRVAHHVAFPDFTLDELMAIASMMMADQSYVLTPAAAAALRADLEQAMARPRFAHGRSVRNAVEQARLRQAYRIVSDGGRVRKEDLLRIEDSDVRRSA